MVFKTINEGSINFRVPSEKKMSKKLPVFYNPIMKFNRDISILILSALNKLNLRIALPLAGTGVRGIRFLSELDPKIIREIYFNDYSNDAISLIKKNFSLNDKLNSKSKKSNSKTFFSTDDANLFLLNSKGFDYIDIDPFGTPNPFLDSSIKRISRDGILAVTATDTSALCGTYPKACLRKYWAKHKKNPAMHEVGLRILIRKVQLVASQFDRAAIPIFSYSRDHYMRVFFSMKKSKDATSAIFKQHSFFGDDSFGPIWTGQLWDYRLVDKMVSLIEISDNNCFFNKSDISFLSIINQESKVGSVGFFDIHSIVKDFKLKDIPKKDLLFSSLKKGGFDVSSTHFSPVGIRSDVSLKVLISVIKQLSGRF